MWIDFMRTALKNRPELPFTPPAGIIKRSEHGVSDFFIKDQVERKVSFHSSPSAHSTSSTPKRKSNGAETHEGKTVEALF
jgi:membrane carboxypeptidase/penicillin-binding protein